MKQGKPGVYARYIKRILDVLLSGCALVVLTPVLLIVAVLVRTKLCSPIIFCQERPGKDEKIFKMYKFRSMTDARGENGELLPDEVRLTKFGRALRSTSLDELPQFINILKGDMSFIGPRPTLTYHPWKLEEYTDFQRRRFEVRPGITGLAQVHGRKAIDWNDRIKYDVEYVDNLSLGLDCKILFQTVWNVLTMKDNDNVGKTSQTKENKDA